MRVSERLNFPPARFLFMIGILLLVLLAIGSITAAQQRPTAQSGPGLAAFRSDEELRAFLRRLRARQQREMKAMYDVAPSPPSPVASAPVNSVGQEEIELQQANVSEELVRELPGAEPSITNNQEKNVDEGGIVKQSGDILVILRRGRLFTVSTAGGGLAAIDSIDAFPPGVDASGDWYDEMLLSGDRIVTVGYSYSRGGTEISRFRLDAAGRLRFEDAYHLRSNDYYSSRNYASRLIGDRLIFYTPLYLEWDKDPLEALPGLRRWRGKDTGAFKRIAEARTVYIPPRLRNSRDAEIDTLHSVVGCDLTAAELDCEATAVLGPSSRTFYVSGSAVYLWMSDAWSYAARRRRGTLALLYRLPLGGERPSAIAARGAPVDQFSFREDAGDKMLNILLRAEGGDDFMFSPEVSAGDVSLLRLPLEELGDGSREALAARYRPLPSPKGESWSFRNRFVGPYILYGAGAFGEKARSATLVAAPVRGGPATELRLPHGVDRIEALGRDALVVGGLERGLGFTAVELAPGSRPSVGDRYVHPDSAEGETRSHAFFFRPDPDAPDGASGILGLPVARRADPAFRRFFGSAAAMVFLRRRDRRFAPAGELEASTAGVVDDDCRASCVDWYGNARPIFLRSRTFALLGYELVEGRLEDGRIREVARLDFSPRPRRR
jgi:hypothetical protein